MTTITKPLIPNKSWIVENDGIKIGTIYRDSHGFTLHQNGKKIILGNDVTLPENVSAPLIEPLVAQKPEITKSIHGFPTSCIPYNPIFDVQKKLPIYTSHEKSRCQLCAGYYLIKINDKWIKQFCPKLIKLQRYAYLGPFKSDQEMNETFDRIHPHETN